MSKIYFHPQSISNKHIQFQNAENDKIKYSYMGSFTQRGVDYEEITLTALHHIKQLWNPFQGNTTIHDNRDREMLALWMKYFYVERNFNALNAIIKEKNQKLIDADKTWASNNTFIKIAAWVLKLFCFDLIQYLHRKYEKAERYSLLKTGQHVCSSHHHHSSFVDSIDETLLLKGDKYPPYPLNKEFYAHLQVKGQPILEDRKEKNKQIYNAWEELVSRPNALFEDGFALTKEVPNYDFESLYRMDLPNTFHSIYVNGHMVDADYVPSPVPDNKNGHLLADFNNNYQIYCDPAVPQFFAIEEKK